MCSLASDDDDDDDDDDDERRLRRRHPTARTTNGALCAKTDARAGTRVARSMRRRSCAASQRSCNADFATTIHLLLASAARRCC